jgi:membrane-associated HD superfamily phosphohydrolase
MAKLDELKAERAKLETQSEKLQKEAATQVFNVEIEDVKMIKTIQDHLNKGYQWTTKNAAIVVTLFDKLKTEKARINKELEENEDYTPTLELKAYELNGLYQALLNVSGQGVENARKFIRMLTLVGESVTNAMGDLTDSNKVISELHIKLKDLDVNIESIENTEEVEPTLETVTDGASTKK